MHNLNEFQNNNNNIGSFNNNNIKQLEFDYKLKQGICKQSHGIAIAKLANMPDEVIINAQKIVDNMYSSGNNQSI